MASTTPPPPSIQCLAMHRDDLDAVAAIECAATEFPWPRSQFADGLSAGYLCAVIHCNGRCCGFTVFSQALDEATLLNIAIHPNAQSAGLGRRLLVQGLDRLQQQGVAKCFLEVRVGNKLAQGLYRSLGFEQVGERKNYYPARGERENALVMCRHLAGGSDRLIALG